MLLRAVEKLHAIGFAHRDIRTCNVRVNESDPNGIYLVDFGLTKSILYADKFPRKLDLDNMVDFLPMGEPATLAFIDYIERLDDDACPNYPALIQVFEILAEDPHKVGIFGILKHDD
jgi:serine/threonine protein kinase